MKYNTLQHIYILIKLVKTENGLFNYIYNNVSYIKRIKVERKDPTSRTKLS
jgi:hypothetical protein